MMNFTRANRLGVLLLFTLIQSSLQSIQAQGVNQCPSCWQPVIRQKLHFNQSIPNSSIRGYTETVPPNYNPNGAQRYPLIINIHGQAAQGTGGSVGELCLPACEGATIKLEQYLFPETVVHNGVTYGFIVLTPQYNGGTSSDDLARFIDYALTRYRADPSRVYLTGLSLGSNVIMNYVTSSVANARKVAGIVPLAGCSAGNGGGANIIDQANVRFWGIHCMNDNVCGSGNTTSWASAINAVAPGTATATLTPTYNPDFPHDIFSIVYNGQSWKTQPANNLQKNITEWMIQYTQGAAAPLPATLGNYSVSLKNKQVVVDWTTSLESESDYFVIERAGPDMQFKQVSGQIKAAGNSNSPIRYSFTDAAPSKGTSFYRLVLVNKDGLPDIYEIKKVINREFGGSFSISPVPANKTIELYFELDESQKLNFAIRDINGRLLRTWSETYTSGVASKPINIESLAPGVYYFSIQGTRFSESKKFIKL